MSDVLLGSRICGGNTAYSRNQSDFYPTPPDVTKALLDFLCIPRSFVIWEPACGANHMVDEMKRNGYTVIGTDIQTGTDFLTCDKPSGVNWIITNPPFSQAKAFIERCAVHHRPFALLLKSQYWHAKSRQELFWTHLPSYILPLTWRPDFLFKSRGSGSPLMNVMWCVWLPNNSAYPFYLPLKRPIDLGEKENRNE